MASARRGTVLLLAALLGAGVSGCGIPVPPEKQTYVGVWRSPDMDLVISADGRVEYERRKGAATTEISAPLRKFLGDDFEVGVWGLTTVFHVERRPYQVDGDWKLVVDGVELTRVR